MSLLSRAAIRMLAGLTAAAVPHAALAQSAPVLVGNVPAAGVPAASAQPTIAPIAPIASDTPFAAAPLDDGTLGAAAGREDTQQAATATQVAGVSQNSVGDNVRTGDARIADNAFQNMSGLSNLNVNTGNNVAINAAMNVNIAIQPAP